MDAIHKTALQDLLTVQALSEIQPVRVQEWQAAARALLGVEPPVEPASPVPVKSTKSARASAAQEDSDA
jgi:hypothetical protein